jgi:T5orf172 domain
MPTSFNVFEGFFEFCGDPPAKFFAIRPEKDHLFSLADFLDYVTGGDSRNDGMRTLLELRDGIIHNFTPLGDARELAFLHADSSRFVVAGFTMVRREDQLHWAMIGGPICDLGEKTRELRSNRYDFVHRPPEKAFIDAPQGSEFRAEPLVGTEDVWKTIVFGRLNLTTEKLEVRAVYQDCGNHYSMTIDDPETLGIRDLNSLSQRESEQLDIMVERIEKEGALFEIAATCFHLPAYFAFRITLVRETKRDTAIAAMSAVKRSQISSVNPEKRPLFRTVAALEIVDIGRLPAIRSYTPPQYKVEVNGFWRKLDLDSVGKDVFGNPIKGRTWVKGHLRWRDRPQRQSTMFVKSSVVSAKAKAAAIMASDPSAVVLGENLPPIFPVEIEPDDQSTGWLYVMRCPLMDDDVYKIGWSSRTPKDRAEELSKATSVPMAIIVVESWKVEDARRIEATVHHVLTTFRINPRREFFKAPFEKIRAAIVGVLST